MVEKTDMMMVLLSVALMDVLMVVEMVFWMAAWSDVLMVVETVLRMADLLGL